MFDLDRTIIAGSSAKVFGEMLRVVGIDIPAPAGRAVYFGLYERLGEDPVTMRLARYASRLFAGHAVDKVEAAGRLAADVLMSDVLPQAMAALERHRTEGAIGVLATTAPLELAQPLAANIGFDDVVCTRFRAVDGKFDGTIDGPFVWGREKADAVVAWATAHDVDLDRSYAYTDSWSDLPLLGHVGHPVAVNADLGLRAAARLRGWQCDRWAIRQ